VAVPPPDDDSAGCVLGLFDVRIRDRNRAAGARGRAAANRLRVELVRFKVREGPTATVLPRLLVSLVAVCHLIRPLQSAGLRT
jgi:hypothetical protein